MTVNQLIIRKKRVGVMRIVEPLLLIVAWSSVGFSLGLFIFFITGIYSDGLVTLYLLMNFTLRQFVIYNVIILGTFIILLIVGSQRMPRGGHNGTQP
ncbi:hypothetical protein ACVQ8P_06610 [Dellaglioa sp. BT-FLS60]